MLPTLACVPVSSLYSEKSGENEENLKKPDFGVGNKTDHSASRTPIYHVKIQP
jgi:hypothetical protein